MLPHKPIDQLNQRDFDRIKSFTNAHYRKVRRASLRLDDPHFESRCRDIMREFKPSISSLAKEIAKVTRPKQRFLSFLSSPSQKKSTKLEQVDFGLWLKLPIKDATKKFKEFYIRELLRRNTKANNITLAEKTGYTPEYISKLKKNFKN